MREDIGELKSTTEVYLNKLLELYARHDPRTPNDQFSKTRDAYHAIELCWRIMDRVADWAQRHIIGIEYATECSSELKNHRLFEGLYDDDGKIEDDHPNLELIPLEEVIQIDELSSSARRSYIRAFHMSTSAEGYHWRNELMNALHALNEGGVLDLFTPEDVQGQGDHFLAWNARKEIIQYICFLHKQGRTKISARETVGEAIGKSVETLRDWEKLIRKTPRGGFDLETAEVAGEFQEYFANYYPYAPQKNQATLKLEQHNKRYDNLELLPYASVLLREWKVDPLPRLKSQLDQALRNQTAG